MPIVRSSLGAIAALSPLVKASGVVAAFAIAWFMVNTQADVGPEWLRWAPSTVGAILVTGVYFATARTAGMSAPTARFWRHQGVAGLFVGLGATTQAIDVLADPGKDGPRTGPVMLALDGIAIVIIVYSLWRLPLGRSTTAEKIRVALDAGTVMVATAAFVWHFQTRFALRTDDRGSTVLSLLLTVLALAAVLIVARVALSSHVLIDKGALRMFAWAMLVGSLGPLMQAQLDNRPGLLATQATVPAVYFLAACAGDRQQKAAIRGDVRMPRTPRAFSVLPYAAVAMVDVLLVVGIATGSDDMWAIGAAVITTTALVVLRQLIAFRDNARLLKQLDHSAGHDTLTDLPNRTHFHRNLRAMLGEVTDQPVAVILIDLDDFKEVNDSLGHGTGDDLLIEVARRLSAQVRPCDTVARLGGDEFVLCLRNTGRDDAERRAVQLEEVLNAPVMIDGHELYVHASIGITVGGSGDDLEGLLQQADLAMYSAKERTGTAHVHFTADMSARLATPPYPPSRLHQAITDGELVLLYQPIVSMDSGRVLGAEALVRWAHPVDGMVGPDQFIPLAERTGLIVPLTRHVLRSALAASTEWLRDDRVLNVNISARDLREADFASGVSELLAEHGVPAHQLVLEVTETVLLENGQSVASIAQLRRLGVRISLDDFGTGHSLLTSLHDCPVDEIKLDRSFTQAPVDSRVPMAAAVIHLAQALGLHAVAEGVETQEQAELLRTLGYTAAQGYLLGHPMPLHRFLRVLQDTAALQTQPQ